MFLPLTTFIPFIFVFAIMGAFCAGTVMCRSLYTALLLSENIHPSLIVAAVYTVFKTYIQAFELFPVLRSLPVYYVVGAPTLLVSLIFFFPIDGDEMERRRVLPENKLRFSTIWPPLLFFILAQISFAYYEVMLFPKMPEQPLDYVLRLIPNTVVLLIFFIFGRKITVRGVLVTYAAVFTCAVLVFLTGMGRVAAYMFTEPAYLFYDLFFFWLLISAFRMYGRNNTRLKLFISIDVALGVVVIMLAQLAFPLLPAVAVGAVPLFLIVVGSILLIPKVEQTIKNMDAQGEYAESRSERDVPLPDQREDILAARGALLQTLPPGVTLTAEEQITLAYLIDGQPSDVSAHFMDIPVSRVNTMIGDIVSKFGCKNKNELEAIMGAAQAGPDQRERMRKLLETEDLTQEERDVALLLVDGLSRSEIIRKLRLSSSDADKRIGAIRNKISGASDFERLIAAVANIYKLTGSETKMLRFLREKMTNQQIAVELILSEETIKRHVRNLIRKLPVEDRKQIPDWLMKQHIEL
jgi:DNA-binding CsgD family transcriptional regulator